MDPQNVSVSVEWGKVTVRTPRGEQTFRDAIVRDAESWNWDWRVTDTHHEPGVLPKVVEPYLTPSTRFVVLGRGFERKLQVAFDTAEFEAAHGNLSVIVRDTPKAVEAFNSLAREQSGVLGFFHSTC